MLPMITLPIISRIIGPDKYGAINYAFAFVSYFILFINAGFDLYGCRKIVSFKDDKLKIQELFSQITWAKTFISAFTTIAFVISLFLVEQVRQEMLVNIFTYLLCIGWILNPSWLYNGMQDSRKYSLFSFFSKLLFSIAVVFVVQQKSDYIYQPLITSLAHILVSYISLKYALKKYSIRLQTVSFKSIKQTLKENKNLSIIWWISNQSSSTGIFIAGFMLATMELGYYSAAFRLIVIIQSIVSMPLNTVLFPYIGSAFAKSSEEGMERVNKTLPYVVLISLGMAGGTFLVAEPLVMLFFGNAFSESILLLKILALGLFFSTINIGLGQQVMLNLKKDRLYVKFITGGFVISILSLLLLINIYGAIGAAIAWPFAEAIMLLGYMIYFNRHKVQVINAGYYSPKFLYSNLSALVKSRK